MVSRLLEPSLWKSNSKHFVKLFHGRETPIKSALLNQKLLSGVGNIYADESLFRAGVRPRRKAASLTQEQLRKLFLAVQTVLKEAIAAGGFFDLRLCRRRWRRGAFSDPASRLWQGRRSLPGLQDAGQAYRDCGTEFALLSQVSGMMWVHMASVGMSCLVISQRGFISRKESAFPCTSNGSSVGETET